MPDAIPLEPPSRHPADAGARFRFLGRVRRAGRTVTFVDGDTIAIADGRALTIGTMQTTMMPVRGRYGVRH
jgi:hypothetical protein